MRNREFLSPKQLSVAIGASESSLKRWIDKGLLPVAKTAGGHRRISMEAAIRFLRSMQIPLIHPESLGLGIPVAPGPITPSDTANLFYEHLITADRAGAFGIAMQFWMSGHPVYELADQVVAPAMHRIGLDWEHGVIDVYQEHHAVEITAALLHELRRFIDEPAADAPLALGAALSGDPYVLPGMLVELTLQESGWHTMNLGADLPRDNLIRAIRQHQPRLVWISVGSHAHTERIAVDIAAVASSIGHRAELVVGGRGLRDGGSVARQPAVTCQSLAELHKSTLDMIGRII